MLLWNLIRKDLLLEWKNKDAVLAMTAFTALVLLLFAIAVESIPSLLRDIAPGAVWITYLFAAILGFNRLAMVERENNAMYTLLVAPIDRSLLFISKFIVNFLLISLVQLLSLPLIMLFFNIDVFVMLGSLSWIFILTTLGMSAIGTLFSAMLVNIRMKDVLMPLLTFPLLVPLLIAAVSLTRSVFNGLELRGSWTNLLIAYDIIFITAGIILYEFLLEE